jgi:hypothetical protein
MNTIRTILTAERQARLDKLVQLNAPKVILDAERSMFSLDYIDGIKKYGDLEVVHEHTVPIYESPGQVDSLQDVRVFQLKTTTLLLIREDLGFGHVPEGSGPGAYISPMVKTRLVKLAWGL